MADLTFARQFLSTLSNRPSKLSSTHVEDPKTYPARGAVRSSPPSSLLLLTLFQYILSHSSLPPLKKRKRATASTDKVHITLTSPRNPPLSINVDQPASISVLELKNIVSEDASIPVAKIKVLYGKKPVHDAKTLFELLGDEQPESVELGLMIMGGAASVVPREPKSVAEPKPNIDERPETQEEREREIEMKDVEEDLPSAAVGMHGKDALNAPEFWDDLKGFLTQRLKDEKLGHEVADRFKQSLVGGI